MKNILFRSVLLVLSLVMVFSMFTACGKQAEPSTDAIVDAAVKAALDAVATTTSVTIDADGKQVTIEDAAGKTIRQRWSRRVWLSTTEIFSPSLPTKPLPAAWP